MQGGFKASMKKAVEGIRKIGGLRMILVLGEFEASMEEKLTQRLHF